MGQGKGGDRAVIWLGGDRVVIVQGWHGDGVGQYWSEVMMGGEENMSVFLHALLRLYQASRLDKRSLTEWVACRSPITTHCT